MHENKNNTYVIIFEKCRRTCNEQYKAMKHMTSMQHIQLRFVKYMLVCYSLNSASGWWVLVSNSLCRLVRQLWAHGSWSFHLCS